MEAIRHQGELQKPDQISKSRIPEGRIDDSTLISSDVKFLEKLHSAWVYFYQGIDEFQEERIEAKDMLAASYCLELYISLLQGKNLIKTLTITHDSHPKDGHIQALKLFFNFASRQIALSQNTKEAKQDALEGINNLKKYIT